MGVPDDGRAAWQKRLKLWHGHGMRRGKKQRDTEAQA